jgi:hypothetical protein
MSRTYRKIKVKKITFDEYIKRELTFYPLFDGLRSGYDENENCFYIKKTIYKDKDQYENDKKEFMNKHNLLIYFIAKNKHDKIKKLYEELYGGDYNSAIMAYRNSYFNTNYYYYEKYTHVFVKYTYDEMIRIWKKEYDGMYSEKYDGLYSESKIKQTFKKSSHKKYRANLRIAIDKISKSKFEDLDDIYYDVNISNKLEYSDDWWMFY